MSKQSEVVKGDLPAVSIADLLGRATIDVYHPTLPSAAALFRLSRSAAYDAAAAGHFPTLRVGDRRLVVPVPALLTLLGYDQEGHEAQKQGERRVLEALGFTTLAEAWQFVSAARRGD